MILKKDVFDILEKVARDVGSHGYLALDALHMVRGAVLNLPEASDMPDEDGDFNYILSYIGGAEFFDDFVRQRLRSLWTAHCMRFWISVDSGVYDGEISAMARQILGGEAIASGSAEDWRDELDPPASDWMLAFERFMRKYVC